MEETTFDSTEEMVKQKEIGMYQSSKLIHTGSHGLKEYFTKYNKTRTWLTKLISKSLHTRIRRYNLYVYLLLSVNTYSTSS